MANLKGVFMHNSDEWATPQELYDKLDAEFSFNLDPCCTEENHKASMYFTLQENGLEQSWGGGAECSVIHRIQTLRTG